MAEAAKRESVSGGTSSEAGVPVPFAEAPDLADRNALRVVVGSFSRAAAIGVPVVGQQPEPTVVVDAAIVAKYGETISLIAQLEREQVTVRFPRQCWQALCP